MAHKVYYAIGDVHGRIAEFKALIKLINNDIKKHHTKSDVYIIQIGDIIDRGENSKACLEIMMSFQNHFTENCTCIALQGNHEMSLTQVYDGNCKRAVDWFDDKKGTGHTTLRDYGADISRIKTGEEICHAVKKHVPKSHINFAKQLPVQWQDGDYFFCHAGIDFNKPLKEQSDHDLRWIREPFLSHVKPFEKIIVHGHSPAIEGEIQHNRVNTDAAAGYGEKLKCFILPERYKMKEVRTLEVGIKATSTFKDK